MRNQAEKKLCRGFVRMLNDCVLYGQIARPDSFLYWHNDNGQKVNEGAFLSHLFKTLPFLKKYKEALIKALRFAAKIGGKESKDIGAKKGVLDYTFLWRTADNTPYTGFLEAKVGDNDLEPEQEDFLDYCHREKIPAGVFYSEIEALRILKSWGVFREGVMI